MFKDILVHIDSTAASARRLDVAAALAERSEAHLTGLHVNWLEQNLYWADPYAAGAVLQAAEAWAADEAARTETQFREGVAGRAITSEWRIAKGPQVRTLAAHGRLADLIVVGQHDPDGEAAAESAGLAEQVALSAGRPCLVVPYIGARPTLGERILIAWNGSREAVRAVNDALPFLKAAKKVHILAVENHAERLGRDVELPTDIAAHLCRHGVAVEAGNDAAGDISIGELLLSRAADLDIDLLVMGCYGHARLRELILGGVSRKLLEQTTVPLLMSH